MTRVLVLRPYKQRVCAPAQRLVGSHGDQYSPLEHFELVDGAGTRPIRSRRIQMADCGIGPAQNSSNVALWCNPWNPSKELPCSVEA
jgi:hypothetical protein